MWAAKVRMVALVVLATLVVLVAACTGDDEGSQGLGQADAAAIDAAAVDASTIDASSPSPDAADPDAGSVDAAVADAALPDALIADAAPLVTVSGRVVDEARAPQAGVLVVIDGAGSTTTDVDGRFELDTDVPYTLSVRDLSVPESPLVRVYVDVTRLDPEVVVAPWIVPTFTRTHASTVDVAMPTLPTEGVGVVNGVMGKSSAPDVNTQRFSLRWDGEASASAVLHFLRWDSETVTGGALPTLFTGALELAVDVTAGASLEIGPHALEACVTGFVDVTVDRSALPLGMDGGWQVNWRYDDGGLVFLGGSDAAEAAVAVPDRAGGALLVGASYGDAERSASAWVPQLVAGDDTTVTLVAPQTLISPEADAERTTLVGEVFAWESPVDPVPYLMMTTFNTRTNLDVEAVVWIYTATPSAVLPDLTPFDLDLSDDPVFGWAVYTSSEVPAVDANLAPGFEVALNTAGWRAMASRTGRITPAP